ncbi:hypothetical protein GOBAR_AA02196 [Gossypium barbadense]|uniref:Uncharacterized protein n=1 Tax=Gossypium barbadense TaxID=3634 RepID=A0A2P5YS28_GOSBA|nr:hypothetical protein GOBAR_AA02196 [Gossypium barbadense]
MSFEKGPRIGYRDNTHSKAKNMTEEELARMAKLEEQIKRMMEMMTTMVKCKANVGEGSDTLDNPIPFYSDTGVYHKDLPLQWPGVTIQILRVNDLPASEESKEVDKENTYYKSPYVNYANPVSTNPSSSKVAKGVPCV